jgi:hypothetical protein
VSPGMRTPDPVPLRNMRIAATGSSPHRSGPATSLSSSNTATQYLLASLTAAAHPPRRRQRDMSCVNAMLIRPITISTPHVPMTTARNTRQNSIRITSRGSLGPRLRQRLRASIVGAVQAFARRVAGVAQHAVARRRHVVVEARLPARSARAVGVQAGNTAHIHGRRTRPKPVL